MEIQFVIVRSENAEYLCHNVNGTYVDVSDPSTEFVSGEDDFRLVEPDSSLTRKEYEFRGERFYLMPQFYGNGWLALTLQSVEDETEYIVLSVNLESMDALDLPDRTFIDVNHYPDAMEFLEGKHHTIMKKMEQEMLTASENMEFERAAALRDKIAAIKSVAEKQKISTTGLGDAEVIGCVRAYQE